MQGIHRVRTSILRRFGGLRVVLALAIAGGFLAGGCGKPDTGARYQGYLEAEFVYVASPLGGVLRELNVSRGDTVAVGTPLFALDPEPEAQALAEAQERLRKSEAQLGDLQKGRRPSEIDALEAQRRGVLTDLALAEQLLHRREQATAGNAGAIAAEELDQSRTRVTSLQAQLSRLDADLVTARLGAREDQVRAAAADVDAAKAAVARARWSVDQKHAAAGVAGTVHDTLYRPGEWVASGNPVLVLLPPENIKVRFFVPEADLPQMKPGAAVAVTFDGDTRPHPATVNYVSTRAEFTPPVIYSQQTRTKLVFMVEAAFPAGTPATTTLRPGQPVDVTPLP